MPPWGAGSKPKAKTVPWETPSRPAATPKPAQIGPGGAQLPVDRFGRAQGLDSAYNPHDLGGGLSDLVYYPHFDKSTISAEPYRPGEGGGGLQYLNSTGPASSSVRTGPPSGRGAVSTGGFGQGVGAASAPSYNMSDILKAATSGAATAPAANRVAQPSQQELMRAATSGASTHPAAQAIQQPSPYGTADRNMINQAQRAGAGSYARTEFSPQELMQAATSGAQTAPAAQAIQQPAPTPYAPTQQELMLAATSGAATHPAAGMFGTRVPGLVDDPADKKFVEPGNVRAHLPGTGTVGGAGGGFSTAPADKKFVEPGNVRANLPGTGAGGSGGGGFGGDGAGGGGAPAPIVRPNEGTVSPFGDGFGDLQRKMARYQFLEEKYGRAGARYMTDLEKSYKEGLRALPGTYNRRGMLDSGLFDRGGTELFADYYGDDYGALPRYLSTLGENLYGLDLGAYGTQDAYNVTGEADLQNRAKALIERMTNLNNPVAGSAGPAYGPPR